MKTESILVPHFEGYRCIGLLKPRKGHYVISISGERLIQLDMDLQTPMVVYEKIPPKRYIFEETGEKRQASYGEYYLSNDENFMLHPSLKDTVGVYPILRRIDE